MAPFGNPTGGGSAGGEATAGGNTSGGSTAGGNAAGGNTAGGNTAGGNAAGGGPVFLPDGGPAFCNLPQDRLRFGNVTLGTSRALTFSVDNPTSQPLEVTINPSSGAYSTMGATGSTMVAPGASATVTVTFTPTATGQLITSLSVRRAPTCPFRSVALEGRGLTSSFEWTPTTVEFGYVPPGSRAFQLLLFRNGSAQDVTVSGFLAREGTQPSLLFTRQSTMPMVVVPAHGEASEFIAFEPRVLGPRTGTLLFQTTVSTLPNGTVLLRGFGGGPVIGAPSTVSFGRVAVFPTATPPTEQTRAFEVRNVGTAPAPPDPLANLILGRVFNQPGQLPLFDLIPDGGSAPGEFDVSVNVPPTGLTPTQAGTVDVIFRPTSPGPKSATLRLYSNDVVTPAKDIRLEATAVSQPACTGLTVAELSPTTPTLDFGTVDPGTTKRRGLTLVNGGTAACLISDLRTGAGFRMVGGPIPELELQPGERRVVQVEATPTTTGPLTGFVRGFVSSPTAPTLQVPLSATGGSDCLVFSVRELDFGNNAIGCRSAPRTVQLFNRCGTSIQFTGASVIGSGFTLAAPPTGTLLSTSAPASVSLTWRTTLPGPETGALVITSTQNTQPVRSVLLLSGVAGPAVDTFFIPTAPKVDVLFVVDDSGSMSEEQAAMAANLNSFFAPAALVQASYQLGLTSTDMAFGNPQAGRLRGTPPVLTGLTPNLLTTLSQRIVGLGVNGDGTEQTLAPAVAALTPPLATGLHAGFLRDDATLAIVGVSDADDQSPLPVSTYAVLLGSLKGPNAVSFSAFTPLMANAPVGCAYDLGPGTRTLSAVTALRGVSEEICSANWATAMANLGGRVFGPRLDYTLRAPVSGGSVSVSINGMAVAPTTSGGSTVWTFSAATNTLTFASLYAPTPGQTVTVSYPVACLP
jgi:hypothetical protein